MTIKDLKEALSLFAADSADGENTPVSITIDHHGGGDGSAPVGESAPITCVGFWSGKEVEIVCPGSEG